LRNVIQQTLNNLSLLKGGTMSCRLSIICLLLLAIFVSPVCATDSASNYIKQEADLASALLERAVAYYQEKQDMALASFSRQGEFVSEEQYVYVLSNDGTMLASGGSSSALIGQNVAGMKDSQGKLFFQEMLNTAETAQTGFVDYHWLNRHSNKVEAKRAFFEKVQDRIIAVGYYIPRATADEARSLLKKASAAVRNNPQKAFAAFNDLNGDYIQNDLYVFAVDLQDGHFRAHGISPQLVNSDGMALLDPQDTPIIQQMIAQLQSSQRGELDYSWRNPITGQVEKKHTFFRKIDKTLVAVGYFTR